MGTKVIGDCYEANGRHFLNLALHIGRRYFHDFKLVHGIVTSPSSKIRHGHCWIETGGNTIIDYSNKSVVTTSKNVYYEIGDIKENETIKYSLKQTKTKVLSHEHWGPWEVIDEEVTA